MFVFAKFLLNLFNKFVLTITFEFFLFKTAIKLSAFNLIHFILFVFLIQNWKREYPVHPLIHVWLSRETNKQKRIIKKISILKYIIKCKV